jgi:RhtB (resistance to homoserine/threonine) family protein
MLDGNILAFVVVATVIVVVPGPDMALVLRNGLRGGRRAALATALGVNAGLVVWALAAALGIAALLQASATTFTLLKLAGAAYLAYLGIRLLLDSFRARRPPGTAVAPAPPLTASAALRQGLLTNLLNPKVAVVYTTFIPQFVQPGSGAGARTMLLAATFVLMGTVWLTAYALAVAGVGRALARPTMRAWVERATGAVLVALGVRLAFERRS